MKTWEEEDVEASSRQRRKFGVASICFAHLPPHMEVVLGC